MTENGISDQTLSEIRLLSEIATANKTRLSIKDISTLTTTELDETELGRTLDSEHDFWISLSQDPERQLLAREYLGYARSFQAWCRDKNTRLFSVSGSTSYNSPLPEDDLDFFTISLRDTVWISLARSMILARIYRILHPRSPRICFSCALDDSFATRAFATGDSLFARDALNIVILQGKSYYSRLLKQSPWIKGYFPRLYRQRLEESTTGQPDPSKASVPKRFLNLFLYFTVGRYLQTKSALLNRRFRRQAKTGSLFAVQAGPDHLIFESIRYSKLRAMYSRLGETIQARKPQSKKADQTL